MKSAILHHAHISLQTFPGSPAQVALIKPPAVTKVPNYRRLRMPNPFKSCRPKLVLCSLVVCAHLNQPRHLSGFRYRSTFQADPAAYQPTTKTGGGYWFEERQRKAAGNSPPLLGTSTYAAEVLHGAVTAAQQLEQSQGINSTLVTYQAARANRWE